MQDVSKTYPNPPAIYPYCLHGYHRSSGSNSFDRLVQDSECQVNQLIKTVMIIRNSKIPLAVYRELAAHLRQVDGVCVEFIQPQIDRPFNYTDSQLDGIEIIGVDRLSTVDRSRINTIVRYYTLRHDL